MPRRALMVRMVEPANKDAEQLELLATFHYVVAGLTALGGCIPFIHLALGIAFVSGAIPANGKDPFPAALFGWFFIAIASVVIVVLWSLAVCLVIAGRSLAARRKWVFCIVVAALSCMMMPFGTVLGIFTLVVLMRDSVRARFTS